MKIRLPGILSGTTAILLLVSGANGLKASPADDAFVKIAHASIEDMLATHPEAATALGDHRFDGRLTDYSAAGRLAEEKSVRAHLAALQQLDAAALTGPNRVDAQILRLNLDAQLFQLTEERPFQWNPLSYNDSLADSVYALIAREFAPPEQRLRNVIQRLQEMPRVIEQIQANLKNPPRVHTETTIKQTAGAINLVQSGFDELVKQVPALQSDFAAAQKKAVDALTNYRTWLERDVLPNANGEFRLGADKFRKKLRYLLDSNLSPEEILVRADRDLASTTEQLYATALPLYKTYVPSADATALADRPRVIRAVFDKLAEKHADDETVVARAKEITQAATEFVRKHQIVTVPETPLKVIVLPEFRRGVAIAYCEPPGALEPNGETFYLVSPTPQDWTAARKLSFYREYNEYMLHDLTVHEAMPGHYLQIAHSNQFKAPTLVRAIYSSGTFVEGWAVYTERVMAEAGFGGPEVKMQQLKMRLRAIINAMIDQKVHAGNMTEKEAVDLMMQKGFQEEGEAVGKWRRVCQSSTQLSSYFVGAIEHDDMRAAAEKKEGAAFKLKAYHDRVLAFGSPAVKYVRQELGY
ncbi:MAG: DUF885 domain-containing protein [Opitutus sp.]